MGVSTSSEVDVLPTASRNGSIDPAERNISHKEDYTGNLNMLLQREGYGTCVYDNGDRYEGEWKGNEMNGKGVYKYVNGDICEGFFVNGHMEGMMRRLCRRLSCETANLQYAVHSLLASVYWSA